jgi:hypothetical protein
MRVLPASVAQSAMIKLATRFFRIYRQKLGRILFTLMMIGCEASGGERDQKQHKNCIACQLLHHPLLSVLLALKIEIETGR